MNEQEKEIVTLMKEWKDEVRKIAEDYSLAIGELSKARESFEKAKGTWFERNRSWAIPDEVFFGEKRLREFLGHQNSKN